MQIYEAGYRALKDLNLPSHVRDIHAHIVDKGYFQFEAQDPVRTLGVAIDRHCKGVTVYQPASPTLFYRASPATYGLLEWLDQNTAEDVELDAEISQSAEVEGLDSSLFLEQELQRWLFKNFEKNKLVSLGFGPLTLVDPDQQIRKMGKFNTGVVGEIDFLLQTERGDYLVCELKRKGDDQTVGQMCRYWGWVKENKAKDKIVHGLILAQEVSESLRYAVKATNELIRFKQLSLEVEIGASER